MPSVNNNKESGCGITLIGSSETGEFVLLVVVVPV